MNKLINIAAAMVISMPLLAQAQNAPQAGAIVASAPGEAAVGQSIEAQGKVNSINANNRTVIIVGAKGNEVSMTVCEDARNFKQLRVGDLVTLTMLGVDGWNCKRLTTKLSASASNRSKPSARSWVKSRVAWSNAQSARLPKSWPSTRRQKPSPCVVRSRRLNWRSIIRCN